MKRKSGATRIGGGVLGQLGTAGAILWLSLAGLTGCAPTGKESPRGFRLPPGNAERGRAAFIALGCLECHPVSGVEFAAVDEGLWDIEVPLGGVVSREKTYGELVTSVIHPDAMIRPEYRERLTDATGASLMPDFCGTMTVRQMVDLVEFLQPHYRVEVPDMPDYWVYPAAP